MENRYAAVNSNENTRQQPEEFIRDSTFHSESWFIFILVSYMVAPCALLLL